MSKQITAVEFDALRPLNSDLIQVERDGEYLYETIVDDEGEEIAIATWKGGEATYQRL